MNRICHLLKIFKARRLCSIEMAAQGGQENCIAGCSSVASWVQRLQSGFSVACPGKPMGIHDVLAGVVLARRQIGDADA